MRIKNRFWRAIIWGVVILIIASLFFAAAGYLFLRYYVVNKINQNADPDESKISVSDITKELGDKQIIDNIINFDKSSASEMLSVITELDSENGNNTETTPDNSNNTDKKDNTDKNDSEQTPPEPVSKEGTTAYQRIMNSASKEEISQGSAIIAKVSMSKVNELRSSGDTEALKAYIKSVLSPGEISTALKLYNKYKHLL